MDNEEKQTGKASPDGPFSGLDFDAFAEFAAGAGHEINNPLAIISGYAQLLLLETVDPNHRRYLSLILAQTRRAYEMIADIRLFARPPRPEPERLLLKKLLNESVDLLNEWGEDRVSFALESCADDLLVICDGAQLKTVLLALGRNSIEAAIDRGRVILACTLLDDNHFELELEDDGPGIPPAIRDKIFFPYFSGRQAGRGLGFGLPKVWRLLQGMHGTISLTDGTRFENGCCWKITIPTGQAIIANEENTAAEKEN